MRTPATDSEVVVAAAASGPLGSVLTRQRTDTAPVQLAPSFLRFVITGVLSVGTDVVTLFLLHSVLHLVLVAATLIGYGLSLVVNYSLNHGWVFQAQGDHRRRLVRYGLLVGVNVASTLAFVLGLTAIGVYYLLAKLLAIAVNAVVNFVAFRHWVFR